MTTAEELVKCFAEKIMAKPVPNTADVKPLVDCIETWRAFLEIAPVGVDTMQIVGQATGFIYDAAPHLHKGLVALREAEKAIQGLPPDQVAEAFAEMRGAIDAVANLLAIYPPKGRGRGKGRGAWPILARWWAPKVRSVLVGIGWKAPSTIGDDAPVPAVVALMIWLAIDEKVEANTISRYLRSPAASAKPGMAENPGI